MASNDNKPTKQLKLDPNIRLDGKPLYVLKGLTKEHMEKLYALSLRLYEEKKYEEARPHFQLLSLLDAWDKRVWLGSAACFKAMKEYYPAIRCYANAAIIDPNDPMPFLSIFYCRLENNEKKKAEAALDTALEIANKQSERYADLIQQAEKFKKTLFQ